MGHIRKYILWLLSLIALSAGQVVPAVTSPVFISGYSQPIAGYVYSKFTGASGTLQPYFISKLNFDSIPSNISGNITGNIVVGAADWLYILNLNLTVVGQLNLPPNISNAGCAAAIGYNPSYVCRNHLRVFPSSPIDPTKLVVCGSEATGTPSCRTVNITNLVNFTTVAAANSIVSIRPDFYYNGIAYNVNNTRGVNFFAVSTLNFNASNLNTGLFFLTVNYTNPTDPNSLTTVLQLRSTNSLANLNTPVFVDTYVANYAPRTALLPGVMDTISPDEHKYFFVFATNVDNTTNTTRSEVIRVCQNDPGYSISSTIPNTLVKARINCQSTAYSTSYNAITGAAFNQMGRYYQNGDWALFMYGVFTTNIGGVAVSAVCVYPAYNSKNDATDAGGNNGGVFDIFRTPLINPVTGTRSSSGYVECTTNGNLARPDYTYTDTSQPITQIGSDPLTVINGASVTKIVLDQTCVVTNNISAQTCVIQDVLFLGTAAGTVVKVAMGYLSGSVFSVISEEIKLDDVNSVRQLNVTQQGGVKYLYVNTDTSIYRLPVQRCSRFLSCSTCVGSQDPYCAWDTSLSQCVVFSIVPTTYNGSASVPNGIYQNIHTGVVNNCTALPLNVPSSILFPSQPAFVGSNINLLCNPNDGQNGATITSYQWVKNGVVLTDGGRVTGSTQSTLSIVSVTLQDQGVYQCSATNVDGVTSGLSNTLLVTIYDIMVTSQPLNQTNILPGSTATFTITAAGTNPISYQWQFGNGTSLPSGGRYQGTTTPTLVISPVVGGDNSSVYMCRVTSPSGYASTTQPAYLSLAPTPVITQQPVAALTVTFGQNASLSCSANGLGPLTVNWTAPPGVTPPQSRQYGGYNFTDTLVLSSVDTSYRGTYMCVVTDSRGTVVSSLPSILGVTVPIPNAVAMASVSVGVFTCAPNDGVGGATITSYQWVKNGAVLSNGGRVTGATQSTLSVSSVMPQDQGVYQCNVTNVDGLSSLSVGTTLLIVAADAVIVTQPSSQEVVPGSSASFSVGAVSVVAGGGGPISYMWQYSNGSQLTGDRFQGTNSSTLTIAPVLAADNGSFFICTVVGGAGIYEISQAAGLTLPTTPLFTSSPANTTGAYGSNITLNCTAVGLGTLNITWSTTSSVNLPPPTVQTSLYTTMSTLSLGPLSVAHEGMYWCSVVDSNGGGATSNMATISVSGSPSSTQASPSPLILTSSTGATTGATTSAGATTSTSLLGATPQSSSCVPVASMALPTTSTGTQGTAASIAVLSPPTTYGIFAALIAIIVIQLFVIVLMCLCRRRGKTASDDMNELKLEDTSYNVTNLLALEKMEEDTDGPPPATKEMAVVGVASSNGTVPTELAVPDTKTAGAVPSETIAGTVPTTAGPTPVGETTAGTVPPDGTDGTAKAESKESSSEFNMTTKL